MNNGDMDRLEWIFFEGIYESAVIIAQISVQKNHIVAIAFIYSCTFLIDR